MLRPSDQKVQQNYHIRFLSTNGDFLLWVIGESLSCCIGRKKSAVNLKPWRPQHQWHFTKLRKAEMIQVRPPHRPHTHTEWIACHGSFGCINNLTLKTMVFCFSPWFYLSGYLDVGLRVAFYFAQEPHFRSWRHRQVLWVRGQYFRFQALCKYPRSDWLPHATNQRGATAE